MSDTLDEQIKEILAFQIYDTSYITLRGQNKLSVDQATQALTKLISLQETKARKDMNFTFPRAMGKTAYFTDIFLKECRAKKTAEYHHPDYVVMSRTQYDKIQKTLNSNIDKEE